MSKKSEFFVSLKQTILSQIVTSFTAALNPCLSSAGVRIVLSYPPDLQTCRSGNWIFFQSSSILTSILIDKLSILIDIHQEIKINTRDASTGSLQNTCYWAMIFTNGRFGFRIFALNRLAVGEGFKWRIFFSIP